MGSQSHRVMLAVVAGPVLWRRVFVVVIAGLTAAAVAGSAVAGGPRTSRVSVSSTEDQATEFRSEAFSVSGDGRYVAFTSAAPNLVAGDTNETWDVFVRDRLAGTTTLVSMSSTGDQGNSSSFGQTMSPDGRYVTFASDATNLVPGDTNAAFDAFLHDRLAGTTSRISVSSAGAQANAGSFDPAISPDGRYVAFTSDAFNLVLGDTNNVGDVFVRDRQLGTTTRVSVSTSGRQANNGSAVSAMSAHGRYVAFTSDASNLVPGDTNNISDVFIRDRQLGTTTRVSVSTSGGQADNASYNPRISADGRYVAFTSDASNLVPGDTNNIGDVFIRDRRAETTNRVSVSSRGAQGNDYSYGPAINVDGRFVAFSSLASNLVPGDTNNVGDAFLRSLVD
jgi:TolB protein